MKRLLSFLFLWSWLVTLPISLIGGYLAFKAIDRFHTFFVRYDPSPIDAPLSRIVQYEIERLIHSVRANTMIGLNLGQQALPRINLFLPSSGLAKLDAHLPQSGFQYTKGRMLIDGKLAKVRVKYRGDYVYHWGWDKKSIRVKTRKEDLYNGLRTFNLIAPKTYQQLNNFLSLQLATRLGLIAPQTELVRLGLNGKDRGVHIFVEQITETTLRNFELMPGDIYRGELVGKDTIIGVMGSLFDSAAVWDKVAVNNHYQEDSLAPLETLLDQVKESDTREGQLELSRLLDMEAWGRFSAYELLSGTKHFLPDHNWRLYYDPWRQKFLPVVWDPAGWLWNTNQIGPAVITTKLHNALFQNGEFLRARYAALEKFFTSEKDRLFLQFVTNIVHLMESEIETDPFLYPGNTDIVRNAMHDLENNIVKQFASAREKWVDTEEPAIRAHYRETTLDLLVSGFRPIHKFRLTFDRELSAKTLVHTRYETTHGTNITDLSGSIEIDGKAMTFGSGFLSNHMILDDNRLVTSPNYFRVELINIDPRAQLKDLSVDYGNGWLPVEQAPIIKPDLISHLYAPVVAAPIATPLIWSGEVLLDGYRTLNQPLIIKPGTVVKLGPGATLVLTKSLAAIGTPADPIFFLPVHQNQEPWGAIVLAGRGADNSTLSHCEISGGSGRKEDLSEYSGMLSIHDVKGVSISNCIFRNNHVVDDMMHAVYSDIQMERVTFQDAFSDALDLDISHVEIRDSQFENSGNDAVDLMSSKAVITGSIFRNNGDKGISVGENSLLLGINNQLVDNTTGIQSKDRSTAILLNHTFKNNLTAIHTFKKNWRYGNGGTIFLGKSTIIDSRKDVTAGKKSFIQLFDSYLETPETSKRIQSLSTDKLDRLNATHASLFPPSEYIHPIINRALKKFPTQFLVTANSIRRGHRINE
jgi:hypothetical protein